MLSFRKTTPLKTSMKSENRELQHMRIISLGVGQMTAADSKPIQCPDASDEICSFDIVGKEEGGRKLHECLRMTLSIRVDG